MEEKFQKQIQRIRKAENRILEKEAQKKKEREKLELEEKEECKRFEEYVQKNFIEYILNYFEKCTIKYGILDYVEFEEKNEFDEKDKAKTLFPTPIYQYFSLHAMPEGNNTVVEEREEYFSIFYEDYVPKSNLAHVFVPNYNDFCSEYYEEPNNYTLSIECVKELFDAVGVNCEVKERYSDGGGDTNGTTIRYYELDNKIGIQYVRHYERHYDRISMQIRLIGFWK